MQPSRLDRIIRWALLIGFIFATGAGAARSNCCCIVQPPAPSKAAVSEVGHSCCQHKNSPKCDPSKCDPQQCEDGTSAGCVECGCSVTQAAFLVYKELDHKLPKVHLVASKIESVSVAQNAPVYVSNISDTRAAIDAQQGCSLMCSWQK